MSFILSGFCSSPDLRSLYFGEQQQGKVSRTLLIILKEGDGVFFISCKDTKPWTHWKTATASLEIQVPSKLFPKYLAFLLLSSFWFHIIWSPQLPTKVCFCLQAMPDSSKLELSVGCEELGWPHKWVPWAQTAWAAQCTPLTIPLPYWQYLFSPLQSFPGWQQLTRGSKEVQWMFLCQGPSPLSGQPGSKLCNIHSSKD